MFSRVAKLICALIFLLNPPFAFSQSEQLAQLSTANTALVSNWARALQIPEATLSVWVQELGSNNSPLALNAQAPQNPASLMKLLTTYAALEMLGPAMQWRTQLLTTASLQKEVLAGDLIIKGGGDPKLVLQNLWLLLRQLRLQGIREIRGDILLDRTLFDIPAVDPGSFDG